MICSISIIKSNRHGMLQSQIVATNPKPPYKSPSSDYLSPLFAETCDCCSADMMSATRVNSTYGRVKGRSSILRDFNRDKRQLK
jgi:hypothetical protein